MPSGRQARERGWTPSGRHARGRRHPRPGLSTGPADARELSARLRKRDLSVAPAVLNLVENRSATAREQTAALLGALSPGELAGEALGHIVGITGPPGVGRSEEHT